MNTCITGSTVKQLRECRNMTQAELAEKIGVSSKTISKWETAKGLPDISLFQPLAQALGLSALELMNGERIINKNVSANMLRSVIICFVMFLVNDLYGFISWKRMERRQMATA